MHALDGTMAFSNGEWSSKTTAGGTFLFRKDVNESRPCSEHHSLALRTVATIRSAAVPGHRSAVSLAVIKRCICTYLKISVNLEPQGAVQ